MQVVGFRLTYLYYVDLLIRITLVPPQTGFLNRDVNHTPVLQDYIISWPWDRQDMFNNGGVFLGRFSVLLVPFVSLGIYYKLVQRHQAMFHNHSF